MKKVIREHKVAILYSPGFGAGWYSWNTEVPQCLFSPEILELVEGNKKNEITDDLCEKLFNTSCFYSGGASDLQIMWLPEGTYFDIHEYGGSESVQTFDDIKLIA
jgi:hypothetical protein